jgi:hypothetical protein
MEDMQENSTELRRELLLNEILKQLDGFIRVKGFHR